MISFFIDKTINKYFHKAKGIFGRVRLGLLDFSPAPWPSVVWGCRWVWAASWSRPSARSSASPCACCQTPADLSASSPVLLTPATESKDWKVWMTESKDSKAWMIESKDWKVWMKKLKTQKVWGWQNQRARRPEWQRQITERIQGLKGLSDRIQGLKGLNDRIKGLKGPNSIEKCNFLMSIMCIFLKASLKNKKQNNPNIVFLNFLDNMCIVMSIHLLSRYYANSGAHLKKDFQAVPRGHNIWKWIKLFGKLLFEIQNFPKC